MGEIKDLLKNTPLPKMVKVRQNFARPQVANLAEILTQQLATQTASLRPGMRVAITAGSRGIKNITAITKATVDFCKACGAHPFIVSAMGGHGGASEAGQRKVLETYGITEENMGCPVDTAMDAVVVGHTESGHPAYVGKAAAEADGIIIINRVQPHSTFHGEYESGLIKMMAMGLGKQIGAEACHSHGLPMLGQMVREYGLAVHKHAKILFALAIVENAYGDTAAIEALDYESIPREEPRILARAKSLMPRFYFENADVLVVDEIGKDISGDGMDPNITGRYPVSTLKGGLNPQRLAVLDLSPGSNRNGTGIGLADVTTMRLFNKFDREKSYPNVLTTTALLKCRMPVFFDSDLLAIQAALFTCVGVDPQSARVIRIKNTLKMDELQISEALLPEAQKLEGIEIVGEARDWAFDEGGNLF